MLKIFAFEEKMKLGRRSYADADFTKARNCFEEAQLIFHKDFRANFWLARTLVMYGQYDPALEKLHMCRSLRPDLEAELIAEWMNIATDKGASNLSRVNENTDAKLAVLSLKKNIRLLDVISFLCLFVLTGVLVDLIVGKILHIELAAIWRYTVRSMGSAIFLAPLFYRRTVLPESFLSGIATRLEKLKSFCRSKYFYWWGLGVSVELALMVLVIFISPSGEVNMVKSQWKNSHEWLALIVDRAILIPFAFGIVFRGIVFNYVKHYSRFAAYAVSTLLPAILLIPSTNYIVILSILANTFLYEKSGSLSVVNVLTIIEQLIVTTTVVLIMFNLVN